MCLHRDGTEEGWEKEREGGHGTMAMAVEGEWPQP